MRKRRVAARAVLLALVACLALQPLALANVSGWPGFRHDTRQTGYNPDEIVIDAEAVDRLRPAWSADLPLTAAPIVRVGRVIAGGTVQTDESPTATRAQVWAFTQLDGSQLWTRQLPCAAVHSPWLSSLSSGHSAVMVPTIGCSRRGRLTGDTTSNGVMWGLDAETGARRWRSSVPGRVSSAISWSTYAFFLYEAPRRPQQVHLRAIDVYTGRTLWDRPISRTGTLAHHGMMITRFSGYGTLYIGVGGMGAPVASNGNVYFSHRLIELTPRNHLTSERACPVDSGLCAWDLESGRLRWTSEAEADAFIGTPMAAHGLVHGICAPRDQGLQFCSLDGRTGELVGTAIHPRQLDLRSNDPAQQPIGALDLAYVGAEHRTEDHAPRIAMYHFTGGSLSDTMAGGDYYLVARGGVYVGSSSGIVCYRIPLF